MVGLFSAAGRQKANLWLHPKVYRSSLPHDRGQPPLLAQETRTEAVHVSHRRSEHTRRVYGPRPRPLVPGLPRKPRDSREAPSMPTEPPSKSADSGRPASTSSLQRSANSPKKLGAAGHLDSSTTAAILVVESTPIRSTRAGKWLQWEKAAGPIMATSARPCRMRTMWTASPPIAKLFPRGSPEKALYPTGISSPVARGHSISNKPGRTSRTLISSFFTPGSSRIRNTWDVSVRT